MVVRKSINEGAMFPSLQQVLLATLALACSCRPAPPPTGRGGGGEKPTRTDALPAEASATAPTDGGSAAVLAEAGAPIAAEDAAAPAAPETPLHKETREE